MEERWICKQAVQSLHDGRVTQRVIISAIEYRCEIFRYDAEIVGARSEVRRAGRIECFGEKKRRFLGLEEGVGGLSRLLVKTLRHLKVDQPGVAARTAYMTGSSEWI